MWNLFSKILILRHLSCGIAHYVLYLSHALNTSVNTYFQTLNQILIEILFWAPK